MSQLTSEALLAQMVGRRVKSDWNRLADGEILQWEPFGAGMTDVLVKDSASGHLSWYASHGLTPIDGRGPLPSRSEVRKIREAEMEASMKRIGERWAKEPSRRASRSTSRDPSRRDIERDVSSIRGGGDDDADDRLFIGVYSTGIRYADKKRERRGDYLPLAFLPYRTLDLEWERGVTVPLGLREAIDRHARSMQARRGQRFSLSSSDNVSVILGQ